MPSKRIVPEVGSISRSTSRAVVDLPQPDSPTSASVSPRFSVNEMPSTARTTPTVLPSTRPLRTLKCLARSSTSSSDTHETSTSTGARMQAALMAFAEQAQWRILHRAGRGRRTRSADGTGSPDGRSNGAGTVPSIASRRSRVLIDLRDAAEQPQRVGMLRVVEDRRRRPRVRPRGRRTSPRPRWPFRQRCQGRA